MKLGSVDVMRKKIIIVALKLIEDKGAKFTTDEIAKVLGTSKRTIYKYFESKEALIDEVIDYVFEEIYNLENQILENENLDVVKKLKLIFTCVPEGINLGRLLIHMESLERLYPSIYEKVKKRMMEIWDVAIDFLDDAISSGDIVSINTNLLRIMLIDSFKRIAEPDFLKKNELDLKKALNDMIEILLFGILKR